MSQSAVRLQSVLLYVRWILSLACVPIGYNLYLKTFPVSTLAYFLFVIQLKLMLYFIMFRANDLVHILRKKKECKIL